MTDGIPSPEAVLATAGATTTKPTTLAGFLSLRGWHTRRIEPPECLLGEIITRTTRMFLGGPTGKGKTHLGLALAAGMASGQGFAHWRAARAARVLYIDGEMPRDLVQERLRDLTRREPNAVMDHRLFALCAEDAEDLANRWPDLGQMQPLNTPAGRDFVLALVKKIEPDCIIFDNRMSLLTGDMKEELPWTETMPLVQELTRKRIAQIWIDHTGHDASHIYGSKTKEWSFDAVALLEPVENAAADVCFRLRFTKARRRKPSNRADFEPVLLTLADDAWTTTLDGGVPAKRARAMTPRLQGWLRDLADIFGKGGARLREPLPGMKPVLTLTREEVRVGMRSKGRFEAEPHAPLTSSDRTALKEALNGLKDLQKIGMTETLVWIV